MAAESLRWNSPAPPFRVPAAAAAPPVGCSCAAAALPLCSIAPASRLCITRPVYVVRSFRTSRPVAAVVAASPRHNRRFFCVSPLLALPIML